PATMGWDGAYGSARVIRCPGFAGHRRHSFRSPNRRHADTVDSLSATQGSKGRAMTITIEATYAITIEATYENGILKLEQPLPLKPHERVWVTVHRGISR